MSTCIIASKPAYQIGLLWTKAGSQSLCQDCEFYLGGYCSVGRQMTPTFECYEYAPRKDEQ